MSLLEVDETLSLRNLKFEDIEDEPLENLFPEPNISELPSKVVVPIAGFCFKTFSTGSRKRKAFINVCHTEIIPAPDDISEQELKAMWTSDDSGYRVPMSIATPREECDRQGEPCDVYDIAISTTFFKKVETNVYFRTFLLRVIYEGLARKHGIKLSISSGVILKHRKAMGTLQPHRIHLRNSNPYCKLIWDLDDSKTPQYILKLVGRELVGRFHLPNIVEKDIKLQLGEDRMRIEAPPKYLLDIFIPFFVEPINVVALFDCQTDILTVTVPVSSSNE